MSTCWWKVYHLEAMINSTARRRYLQYRPYFLNVSTKQYIISKLLGRTHRSAVANMICIERKKKRGRKNKCLLEWPWRNKNKIIIWSHSGFSLTELYVPSTPHSAYFQASPLRSSRSSSQPCNVVFTQSIVNASCPIIEFHQLFQTNSHTIPRWEYTWITFIYAIDIWIAFSLLITSLYLHHMQARWGFFFTQRFWWLGPGYLWRYI